MKTLVQLTFIMAMLASSLRATTVSTPASIATRGLVSVITQYLAEGGSIETLSMGDIVRRIDIEAANSTAQGKFIERFEILGGKGPIEPNAAAKMIGFTANQISEDRRQGLGRYVLWLAANEVSFTWETEDRVKMLLESAGLPLVNKGTWNQADTKTQSAFHVAQVPKPQPDDNRVQEDVTGRRAPKVVPEGTTSATNNATSQPNRLPSVQPPTPKKATETKSTPTPREEPTSSTPWSIIAVLIVAATGLLWLLVKNHK